MNVPLAVNTARRIFDQDGASSQTRRLQKAAGHIKTNFAKNKERA